eukprot:COSAG04_NODE_686_length_11156_cov_44.791806_2_plen_81_part_00
MTSPGFVVQAVAGTSVRGREETVDAKARRSSPISRCEPGITRSACGTGGVSVTPGGQRHSAQSEWGGGVRTPVSGPTASR